MYSGLNFNLPPLHDYLSGEIEPFRNDREDGPYHITFVWNEEF